MKNPLGVIPSKENQGTTRGRGKEKTSYDLRIRSTAALPTAFVFIVLRGTTFTL